jgi:hypothetical protein
MIEKLLQFFIGEIYAKLFESVELNDADGWVKNKQIRLACTMKKYKVKQHLTKIIN